jgi:aspartate racemase
MKLKQPEKKIIGIPAGMGPKSTGPFIDQVISSFQSSTGAKNDIDFPPIIIYSLL